VRWSVCDARRLQFIRLKLARVVMSVRAAVARVLILAASGRLVECDGASLYVRAGLILWTSRSDLKSFRERPCAR